MVASSNSRSQRLNSVGLWGAPASGKTTYLAALYIAVNRSTMNLNIFGVDDVSTDFMVQNTKTLSRDHTFPEATDTVNAYSWTMNMTTQVQVPDRSRFGRPTAASVPLQTQFVIDMRDAPGGIHASDYAQPGQSQGQPHNLNLGGSPPGPGASAAVDSQGMMEYLAGCEGLLLLIDPVRELADGDSHEYFQSTLLRIAQRRLSLMPPGARLPHYVAVCITKFDHPDVYSFARMNGYRSYDEDDKYAFPRVHDDDAESFFKELCGNSPMGDADLICNALTRYFMPERIRYFVTSAIGFYRSGPRFQDADPDNAVQQNDGTYKIRGQVYPINVLEPMLWLGQNVGTAS